MPEFTRDRNKAKNSVGMSAINMISLNVYFINSFQSESVNEMYRLQIRCLSWLKDFFLQIDTNSSDFLLTQA